MNRAEAKRDLTAIFRAAVASVDPAVLIGRALDRGFAPNSAALIDGAERILLLAIGKASLAMAAELERRLGQKIAEGLAVTLAGAQSPGKLTKTAVMPGGHPLPDDSSAAASEAAIGLLRKARPGDLVITAISGGASAMFAAPAEGLTLEDKIAVNASLLKSGANIRELNCVRKHLSRVKGGKLVLQLPADVGVLSLVLSDVSDDDLATIGSGLTAPDPSSYSDAIGVLKRRRIWGRAPERVRDHLERGVAGEIDETPKPGNPVFARVTNLIVGNNTMAIEAASEAATRMGLTARKWGSLLGEADELGRRVAADLVKTDTTRVCLLAGGEPTVIVHGGGKGGRAQHCALSMALELDRARSETQVAALFAGTDGIDGPTDAAGAFVFSDSVARGNTKGLDAIAAFKRNDAYNFFDAIDDLFRPGPTGTNVTDLLIALVNH